MTAIGKDASKLFKDVQSLRDLITEVAQVLITPAAIDVESEYIKDDITTDINTNLKQRFKGIEALPKTEIKGGNIEIGGAVIKKESTMTRVA